MRQANAIQKQWMKDIAEWVEGNHDVLYDDDFYSSFELHHVLGRSAKHNKVSIGHEFVIPVPTELHNVMSNHPDNVTHFKKNFVKRFGTQRSLFIVMVISMGELGYVVPSDDAINAIQDTGA